MAEFVAGALEVPAPEIVKDHSYEAIFGPFVPPGALATLVLYGPPKRSACLRNGLLSKTWRFCPSCVRTDFDRSGVAPARRSHQYRGVLWCFEHACRLLISNSSDADGAILTSAEALADHDMAAVGAVPPIAELRFATFVHAACNATFPNVFGMLPLDLLGPHIASSQHICDKVETISKALAAKIAAGFSHEALEDAGLDLDALSKRSWTYFLLGGSSMGAHPLAMLIASAALFESLDALTKEIAKATPTAPTKQTGMIPSSSVMGDDVVIEMCNLVADGLALTEVARRYGLKRKKFNLQRWRHRKLFDEAFRIGHQARTTRALTSAQRYRENSSNGSQSGFAKSDRNSYNWLLRYAKSSLDALLPPDQKFRPRLLRKIVAH